MPRTYKTTCPYCGVGCGLLATVAENGAPEIRGDPEHPANFGHLCSKGAALSETLGHEERLLHPEIRGNRVDWNTALDAVAQGFANARRDHGPESVAFYVSGQLLTEDYYIANKLMKGFLGSANIDTNSRLCMASSVAGQQRAFGSDTVPGNYQDLELASLIVLIGSNLAWCHPVLYQRIQQAKNDRPDVKIVVIDPRRTSTCASADLHLAISPGTDGLLFNGLLTYLHDHGHENISFCEASTEGHAAALAAARASAPSIAAVASHCGLPEPDIVRFYDWFSSIENTVSVFSQGINQSSSGTDKVNAIINCHLLTGRIGRPGMGPFSVTGQPNAMGGREVGGLSTQLAAHMDFDPKNVDRLKRFWNSPDVATRPGLKAVDLFRAVEAGRIKALWIMATNPVVSLPDAERVRAALARCPFVVVSDCVRATDTTAHAHVLLPATAWGEKDGTVTNSERRISRQRAFLTPPGEARPDWWILREVAHRLGFARAFDFSGPADIFREHASLSAFENDGRRDFDVGALATLNDAAYDDLAPVQWPVTRERPQGTPRLFTDSRFYTPNGKARFIPVTPRHPANALDANYPFTLNTGRTRDHWHTLTRTGLSPRLSRHTAEPYAEIHPHDARDLEVENGSLVVMTTRQGAMRARAVVSETQRRGSVFVPIHWNDRFAKQARADVLVDSITDPVSGQPEYKQTPVRIVSYQPSWHGFTLSRRQIEFTDVTYCVRSSGTGFWRYELAGDETTPDWPALARKWFCELNDGKATAEWIDYHDRGAGQYRGARLVGGRLETCLFVATTAALPAREAIATLFQRQTLSREERRQLLAGTSPTQDTVGGIVCACFGVGRNAILAAIRERKLDSVESVGACLKAGTHCGSCQPEIKTLLHQERAPT